MELNVFIEYFANQFDETDASDIKSDTIFQDLEEWSSLTAMSVIAFVKTEYSKEIKTAEIRSCATVKDLFDLVVTKK